MFLYKGQYFTEDFWAKIIVVVGNEIGPKHFVFQRELFESQQFTQPSQSHCINKLCYRNWERAEPITDFKDLFSKELEEKAKIIVQDCIIETDLEIVIPDNYVSNISERLQL